ncbi:MAG: hypothetical protein MUC59_12380 [Saprospiraceae bacterium]|nr:hypothetical protein [Saprospiraceae bacterium]
MYRTLLLSIIVCWAVNVHSQNLTGEWAGTITQTGKSTSFNYALSLEQDGQKVFGTATSSNTDGSGSAKFEVGGTFDGKRLVLQELKQLEPENAKWCLKHIRLQYAENQGIAKLEGDWEAQGCKPGTMKLAVRQLAPTLVGGSQEQVIFAPQSAIRNPKSAIEGRFSGHLSQSDRDYGFYFEMKFEPDGTGSSQITSDGEGGNATHGLRWTFDEAAQRLDFEAKMVFFPGFRVVDDIGCERLAPDDVGFDAPKRARASLGPGEEIFRILAHDLFERIAHETLETRVDPFD